MSDLVITSPDPQPVEDEIENAPFWPSIKPEEIRVSQRIDSSVVAVRLRDAIIEAIATVNGTLAAWKAVQIAAGAAALEDVEAEQIAGASIHLHRYMRAVGCLAKASLIERYRDMDTSAQGDRKADAMDPGIEDLRRDAYWAIADIQGRPRTVVDLI